MLSKIEILTFTIGSVKLGTPKVNDCLFLKICEGPVLDSWFAVRKTPIHLSLIIYFGFSIIIYRVCGGQNSDGKVSEFF